MLMLLYCPYRVEQRPPRRWSWSLRLVVIVACLASACVCFRWPHAGATPGAFARRQAFEVVDFVAAPHVFALGGRSLPYHMPFILPSHFDLRVEVLASASDLPMIHIAGHPLASDPSLKHLPDRLANPAFYAESWHQIRLTRENRELSLWIDGRKSPVNLDPKATSEWLTVEPGPNRPACFRNLIVEQ
jgi:hypothetical protein